MDLDFFNRFYVVMYKDEIMIMKRHVLGSMVMRKNGSTYLTCEIAPISEFEIIGEF